jgi:hypothetical protein
MILNLHSNRLRSFTISLVTRLLAVFILSSFAVTLIPIVSSAEDSMPCCVGKAEGHCDSGLMAPKPPPTVTEPMCGLTPVHSQSSRIAETTSPNAESNSSQFSAESISEDCQMDCGACATVTSRQKRQKDLILARITYQTPSSTIPHFDNTTSFYSSNENWTRINPRGPPSVP